MTIFPNDQGRVSRVLLLGGTSEIGLAILAALDAPAGTEVILAGRDEQRLAAAGKELPYQVRTVHYDAVEVGRHQALADGIFAAYAGDALAVRSYAKVEPILLTIYEPGVELVVSSVRIDRDRVRLLFTDPRAPETMPATSFMIQWPAPFSRTFSERPAIDTIIRQYIQPHRS